MALTWRDILVASEAAALALPEVPKEYVVRYQLEVLRLAHDDAERWFDRAGRQVKNIESEMSDKEAEREILERK